MKHKNVAYVNSRVLEKNYIYIKEYIKSHTAEGEEAPEIIAIVKADAYGHGMPAAAKAFGDAGCSFFAVSSEEEALDLREIENKNLRHPKILILGHVMAENVPVLLANDITVALVSAEDTDALSRAVMQYNSERKTNARLKVHVKLDTGMNRVGFSCSPEAIDESVREIARAASSPALAVTGIFTHLAVADEELLSHHTISGFESEGGYTKMQLSRWSSAISALESLGVNVGMKHVANSAATLAFPEAYFDAVRAGVILYGMRPDGMCDRHLAPAMRFTSTVTHIHKAYPGDRVSYGADYTITRPSIIATVAAGYADGFDRAYRGCEVEIGGRKYPQIGRICMDQFMVDVTDSANLANPVSVGDEVTLFGGDTGESVNTLAALSGTINYEVTCRVSKRVARCAEGN